MDLLRLLREGELVVDGRLAVASNMTLVGRVSHENHSVRCVYKPISGERPLWDFPDGTLAAREVAAYEVSDAAGWRLVPPTVLRADGPFGAGMCQLWIEQDDGRASAWVDVVDPGSVTDGWLRILDAVDGNGEPVVLVHADHPGLRRMALFDAVVNNADRKGGHILGADGDSAAVGDSRLAPVVGVDHGVCFNVDPKLRTVLWGWSGAQITSAERDELRRLLAALDGDLGRVLTELLAPKEVTATSARVTALLEHGRLPVPSGRMPVPWPIF